MEWEDYVRQVCVQGRPERIAQLAGDWDALFYNASTVASALRDGIKDLEKTFVGPAGDAYRARLEALAKKIEDIEAENRRVVYLLSSAKDSLNTAQQTMPIPDHMLEEVNNRRAELDRANRAGAAAMSVVGGVTTLPAGMFYKQLADTWVGNTGREAFGWLSSKWDDWSGEMTAEAKKVHDRVNGAQKSDAAATPPPIGKELYDSQDRRFAPEAGSLSSGGVGSAGGLGSGGYSPSGGSLKSSATGFDPLATGNSALDPATKGRPVTGLAGADTSGLTGSGGGRAGLDLVGRSGGAGGGFGSSGVGAGGALGAVGTSSVPIGAGGSGGGLRGAGQVGRAVSFPGGPPGAAGAGRSMGGAGVMGGVPGAAGGAGGGDQRSTWLEEDEDVWGLNDGPSVWS